MNVLITGGAGFIGSHLVEYHLNRGDVVHALDDLSTGMMQNIDEFKAHPNFYFTKTDIISCQNLDEIVHWADRIHHMAAIVGVLKVIESPERVLSTNIQITQCLLNAASTSTKHPTLLIGSTSEVYGEGYLKPFDESHDISIGSQKNFCQSYIVSKIACEAYANAYHQEHGVNIINLRLFNTIGPRQTGRYGMVVPRFIEHALNNTPITIHGTGTQMRSFCDVRDSVISMNELADNPNAIGQVVNMGGDALISIIELAYLIKKLTHSTSAIEYIAYEKIYGTGFEDIMFRQPILGKLYSLTQHRPQWALEATLVDLIEHSE